MSGEYTPNVVMCGVLHNTFQCTERPGHDGNHMSRSAVDGFVYAEWRKEDIVEETEDRTLMTHADLNELARLIWTGQLSNFETAVGYLKTKTGKPLSEINAYCQSLRGHTESRIRSILVADFKSYLRSDEEKARVAAAQLDNPYFPKTRVAKIVIELETYGTEDQQQKSIEKFKKEVALQGLKVRVCSVTLNKDQPRSITTRGV